MFVKWEIRFFFLSIVVNKTVTVIYIAIFRCNQRKLRRFFRCNRRCFYRRSNKQCFLCHIWTLVECIENLFLAQNINFCRAQLFQTFANYLRIEDFGFLNFSRTRQMFQTTFNFILGNWFFVQMRLINSFFLAETTLWGINSQLTYAIMENPYDFFFARPPPQLRCCDHTLCQFKY